MCGDMIAVAVNRAKGPATLIKITQASNVFQICILLSHHWPSLQTKTSQRNKILLKDTQMRARSGEPAAELS